ncbi:MAG: pitrilysin family protein [Acidobacteriota bacterium]
MSGRFDLPESGPLAQVRFPSIVRDRTANGLHVWSIAQDVVPVAVVTLVIPHGSADDPAASHGLASLTADMLDEGAGDRDAIALSAALARMGTQLDIDVVPDATLISFTSLARCLEPSLALLADIVIRPRLLDVDFQRVRELRLSRLRQLSQSASSQADRAFVTAVFGAHPYGHGSMGTTTALSAMTAADARGFWARAYKPAEATLIVGGAVGRDAVLGLAERVFGAWVGVEAPPTPAAEPVQAPPPDPSILLVDRPNAPQSELRVGHVGPPRRTDAYYSLVTMNALLGGQFMSRINKVLREEKGVTYGARSAFDFRRMAGSFSAESNVQGDRTAESVGDILIELDEIGHEGGVPADELEPGKASLTRGYVRQFETPAQLVRAGSQLAIHGLDDDVFDRFVPMVDAVTTADVTRVARAFVRPSEAVVIVAGDASKCQIPLEALGRSVRVVTPDF